MYDPKVTPVVGPRGEFTVSVLYALRDIEVFSGLAIPNMPTTLLHQTQARMRAFFPGCRLDIQPVPQANAVTPWAIDVRGNQLSSPYPLRVWPNADFADNS